MVERKNGQVVNGWTRWWRFSGVGVLGVAVQLLVLGVCLKLPGIDTRAAVAVAVGSAVVHNFAWHRRWTWRDRDATSTSRLFARFAVTNGLISIVGNVVITSALVSWSGSAVVVANAVAIVVCSVANYLVSDRAVFTARPLGPGGVTERADSGTGLKRLEEFDQLLDVVSVNVAELDGETHALFDVDDPAGQCQVMATEVNGDRCVLTHRRHRQRLNETPTQADIGDAAGAGSRSAIPLTLESPLISFVLSTFLVHAVPSRLTRPSAQSRRRVERQGRVTRRKSPGAFVAS